jgi:hypothetical protein
MEELESWRLGHVEEIHVEAQVTAGVCNIFGIWDGTHVPSLTVKGVA